MSTRQHNSKHLASTARALVSPGLSEQTQLQVRFNSVAYPTGEIFMGGLCGEHTSASLADGIGRDTNGYEGNLSLESVCQANTQADWRRGYQRISSRVPAQLLRSVA